MMRCRALTPIRLDGREIAPGDLLELPPAPAAQLIEVGAAERSGDPPPPEDRAALLAAACGRLDPGDPGLWTADGPPRTDALAQAAAVVQVSGAERDAAWARFQAAARP